MEPVKKEGGGLAHDFARFSGEKWVETYTKERITEKTGVNEMLVYEERRKYFKDDLSKHACYASWISVAVLILGRYLILIIKHYIIPFIKCFDCFIYPFRKIFRKSFSEVFIFQISNSISC